MIANGQAHPVEQRHQQLLDKQAELLLSLPTMDEKMAARLFWCLADELDALAAELERSLREQT